MKNSLVSVILTVKSGERTIEKFCEAVLSQTYKNIELIIVDNNSSDKTLSIARKYTNNIYHKGPERSAQRNYGIEKSKGEYILILDADMYLSKNVIREGVQIFENNKEIKCIFIPEETIAYGFWGKCKKFERDFYLIGDLSVEAARFFRRKDLINIGMFDESQTGSEDWDLSDRMIFGNNFKYGRTESTILHDEGKVNLRELVLKKNYYIEKGIREYFFKAPKIRKVPFPFRPSVRKQWYKFLLHPILAVGTIYMKFLEGKSIIYKKKLTQNK